MDLDVQAHAVVGATGLLWSITVLPKAPDSPYLVKGETPAPEKGPTRSFFGLYRRTNLPSNIAYPAEQIHGWIQRGRRSVEGPEGSIADTDIRRLTSQETDIEPRIHEAEEILGEDVTGLEFEGVPCFFYIQAVPGEATRLNHFYEGARDSLSQVMWDQPSRRESGFGLPDGVEPVTIDGRLRTLIPSSESLSVSRNGSTTAILAQRYLTWASERFMSNGQIGINTLALSEFSLSFWDFFLHQVLDRADRPITSIWWRTGIHGLNEPLKLYLPIGWGDGVLRRDVADPPVQDFDSAWAPASESRTSRLAFLSVDEIYGAYGRDGDLATGAVDGEITVEALKAALKK